MRTVRFAIWLDVSVNRTVVGLLTSFHWYAGKALSALLPTVYVVGPQDAMRASEGCIDVRLGQFSRFAGVPSHPPIRKMDAGVDQADVMFWPTVVVPAVTVTVRVATASSPW